MRLVPLSAHQTLLFPAQRHDLYACPDSMSEMYTADKEYLLRPLAQAHAAINLNYAQQYDSKSEQCAMRIATG